MLERDARSTTFSPISDERTDSPAHALEPSHPTAERARAPAAGCGVKHGFMTDAAHDDLLRWIANQVTAVGLDRFTPPIAAPRLPDRCLDHRQQRSWRLPVIEIAGLLASSHGSQRALIGAATMRSEMR